MLNEELYNSCLKYIKTYNLYVTLKENYGEDSNIEYIFKDLKRQLYDISDEINVLVLKLRGLNKDVSVYEGEDRFNYSYTLDNFAILKDSKSDVSFRVHMDDVDNLDMFLNNLLINIINLKRANHNLNRRIINFNKALNRNIDEVDDKYILNILNTLKDELIL